MQPLIEIDTARLRNNLAELVRLSRADGAKVLEAQASLFVRKAVSFTPPRTLAQGRKAIGRDINNAVTSLDPAKARNDRMRQAIEQQDYEVIKAILTASSKGKAWRVEKFTPALHTAVRDRRGRVRSSKRVLTPDRRQLLKYIAETQKRSGYARSGWIPAMQALGLAIPSWMGRHNTTRSGGVDNQLATANPSITMRHNAAKIPNYARTVDSVLKSRIQATNTMIMRLLNNQSVNLGFRTAGPST